MIAIAVLCANKRLLNTRRRESSRICQENVPTGQGLVQFFVEFVKSNCEVEVQTMVLVVVEINRIGDSKCVSVLVRLL